MEGQEHKFPVLYEWTEPLIMKITVGLIQSIPPGPLWHVNRTEKE